MLASLAQHRALLAWRLSAAVALIGRVARVRGKRRSIKGLELTYGATGPLSTTIDELLRPDDPRGWKHIPAGSVQIQMGQESIDKGGSHALWTGQLKKEGLYITISTPKGERVLLELARALHRGRK
ncbi:MAG TPA: hypothetical protein VFU64_00960 [Gaiellaceae bacterium]|nr:hypothetical protein [Gaiellaceae bacterium]